MDRDKDTTMPNELVSSSGFTKPNMLSADIVNLPESATSVRNANSSYKAGDANWKQVKEQVVYYPQNTYGYSYPGHDGSYSRWNNSGYFVPQDQVPVNYNTAQQNRRSYAFQTAKDFYPTGKYPFLPDPPVPSGYIPSSCIPSRIMSNGRVWTQYNQMNVREKFNQRRNFEGNSELICGPRADRKKIPSISSDEKDCSSSIMNTGLYNLQDFPVRYENAKFYMIKSYNEDDVHKSIKYSVWASTPGGNKKLDDTFKDAEIIAKDTGIRCPIFLFFSVNTSGKFIGIAEMMGPVDFKKNMDFWQEERWNGFFPLKWHIVKDVPNAEFRSITLQNNDNKPVFFSRDTQEIRLPQGLQMLQIFKNYQAETSIFDDFEFYDKREKLLRAKRDCIPALVRQEGESEKTSISMRHLEEAMKDVSLSASPNKATSVMDTSFGSAKKPLYGAVHPPENRSLD